MNTQNYCGQIHQMMNSLKRYNYPFDKKELPQNGIYIMFEKGEQAHGLDRIVRVGTHTGDNNLPIRLCEHFYNENKDRSIFRKNIGRALLAKDEDAFLKWWNIDLTKRESKKKHSQFIDTDKKLEVEKQVSNYIRENISFVVFEVTSKEDRLYFEEKLISSISFCEICTSSNNWLGNFSPKNKIRKSGLWLEKGLYKKPLAENDMEKLHDLVR